jgi:3'(2'), 5'-bisphosphate nucleotidase
VENIWDHAAGVVIVKEAGGEVTDLEGKPLDWSHGKKLSHNKVLQLHSCAGSSSAKPET